MNHTAFQPDGISVLATAEDAEMIAQWLFAVFGAYDPQETFDTCRADVVQGLDPAVSIPKTFVYRVGGQLAGWGGVIPRDIQARDDLGPWLANVIVRPEFRGRGIARALVQHVMDYAAALTDVLYLYTDNLQDSYAKLGWRVIEHTHLGDRPIVLMQWDTRRASSPD